MNLEAYLLSSHAPESLQKLIISISEACIEIARAVGGLKNASLAGSENASGENQLALDVQANNIMLKYLRESGLVAVLGSEESDNEEKITGGANYAVASDPLDGSSLVDVNLAVGTIVAIYEGDKFIGRTAAEQVAALAFVYGPRTTMLLTVKEGTHEFRFDGREFVINNRDLNVAGEGRMFAPGNLRAAKMRVDYLNLLNYWAKEQYTLRYSGGMVPDINQILLKGKGVFTYPAYADQPKGKLRLLYECGPMALLMEQAGGAATDGSGTRILDIPIEEIHQRTPIFIGSKLEVEKAEAMMNAA